MASIVVSITNLDTGTTPHTYTMEINNNGCAILDWGTDKVMSPEFANHLKTTDVVDTAKLLAHHMDMHTLCEHE